MLNKFNILDWSYFRSYKYAALTLWYVHLMDAMASGMTENTRPRTCHSSGWLVVPQNIHYYDVIMGAMASQTTSLTIVYSTVYSAADQSKHKSSASLAFVRGIHRGPVISPHRWPVTRKRFPFDDVIMVIIILEIQLSNTFHVQLADFIFLNECWRVPREL